MSVNILAPSLRPPRVSILSSAEVITPPNGDRWMGGIELYPLSGVDASGTYPVCPIGTQFKDVTNKIGAQEFQPWAIYATDNCSTFGSGDVDFKSRAEAKLAVVESYWIERVLWENPDGLANPSFTGSTSVVVVSGVSPFMAFARLDSAVANDLHDGQGMIHVPTKLFGFIYELGVLRREGNVYFSPLDNIVVPGRGYTGNGPNPDGGANANAATATVQWMFGHPGIIQIIRGPVSTLGADIKEMNRAINDVWVTAERAVGFVVSNGIDNAGNAATGFYAASADITLAVG